MQSAAPHPELSALLERQRAAARLDGPPSLAQRRDSLSRLRAALLSHQEPLAHAISTDFGHRSRQETALLEVFATLQAIDYLKKHLRRFMRPEPRHVSLMLQPGRAWVEWQPKGIIGIIAPWNYPLQLALVPIATALAAGNRVMLKPSELAPATAELVQKLLATAFPPEEIVVIQGDSAVAAAFSALPFDHLFFTGSTKVGRKVMAAAAENLVPVTLELGGKSPAIVAQGHLSDHALHQIAFGKLTNAGQTCVAPDYLMVHEDDLPTLAPRLSAVVGKLYPKGIASADYSAIINDAQFARLTAALHEAEAKGATIIPLGVKAPNQNSRKLAPVMVLHPPQGSALAEDEIFGPILPVIAYRSLTEAIAYITAKPRPLAAYWFGPKGTALDQLKTQTHSGNLGINNTLLHVGVDDLPFGGIGASGMGSYHGIEGFRAMSHGKGVFQTPQIWHPSRLFHPPYRGLIKRALRRLLR